MLEKNKIKQARKLGIWTTVFYFCAAVKIFDQTKVGFDQSKTV